VGTVELHADKARHKAESGSGWYAAVARSGLVAQGLSYGLVGALAVKLALGDGGRATSRQGALQSLARHSFGEIVLIALAAGFAAYALWRFLQAYAERPGNGESGWKVWGKRAGYVGGGLVYAGLTYSTLKIVAGSVGQQSQNQKAHHSTATVLAWPAGTWLVGIAGAVLIGVACYQAYRGITHKFLEDSKTAEMSPSVRSWITWLGTFGHLARAVVFALVGIFLIKAAVDYNARAAVGLDGALAKIVHRAYGPYALGLVAAGLVAFAIYSISDARFRKI
jgi:hypothetical protein